YRVREDANPAAYSRSGSGTGVHIAATSHVLRIRGTLTCTWVAGAADRTRLVTGYATCGRVGTFPTSRSVSVLPMSWCSSRARRTSGAYRSRTGTVRGARPCSTVTVSTGVGRSTHTSANDAGV